MKYCIFDRDSDHVTDGNGNLLDCAVELKSLLPESWKYNPYYLFVDPVIINTEYDLDKFIEQENKKMIDHQNVQEFVNNTLGITPPKLEKYVVITQSYRFCGTFFNEEDAINYIKDEIKKDSKERFFIFEAKKEIGRKSPEIEIEEL